MNKVIHFEIPADDTIRATAFYQDVFGWSGNAIPNMGYTIFHTGPTDEQNMLKEPGFINGGMMKRAEPLKNPIITIEVEDIEAALEKIVSNGGRIVQKKAEVGDMGYSAYFKDSEGNIMGLWQNR